MAANQQRGLVRAWYKQSPVLYALLPLSLIYFVISALRKLAYRWGIFSSYRAPIPVIVIGNISVGGTGKTPVVIALVKALQQAGYSPGIISRGYGSHAPEYPYTVTANSPAKHAGDEPLLMAIRTQVPVIIAANRKAAAAKIIADYPVDIILSDDGLQHYALQRDIEIAVVDTQRGVANGLLLPAGPLRELPSRLAQVDYVLLNGQGATTNSNSLVNNITRHSPMALVPQYLEPLAGGEPLPANHWPYSRTVHAVAGIGNPQRFFHTLKQLGFELKEHSFDDHHNYQASDINFNDNLPIIMTEKDAVKIKTLDAIENCWFLPVEAEFDEAFIPFLVKKIASIAHQ